MEKPGDTFFTQLRKLGARIDRECEQYKRAITEHNEECSVPQAIKDITDLKNEIKELKAPICMEIERQKKDVLTLNKTANLVDCLLKNYVTKQVSEIEEYISNYGFKPYEASCEKVKKNTNIESEEDKEEDTVPPNTPPNNAKPVDPNRTPRLEDAGISMETMQYLNSLQKNKPVINRTVPSWGDVPSDFRHNGIICTPSLGRIWNSDISYCTDLHSELASPVLLSAAKDTGVIEDKERLAASTQQQLSANSEPPMSPVFRTPGIKQILTGTKDHGPSKSTVSNKRHVNVGLFQDNEKKETKKTETKKDLDVPDLRSHYDDDLPVEPELTYSLEALSDMTGMYMINPAKNPPKASIKPFCPTVDVAISNKENATPPEPEMLTERMSRIQVKQDRKSTKEFVSIKSTLNDDMPPSPKLFGSYNFK